MNDSVDNLFGQVIKLRNEGKPAEAIEVALRLIELHPDEPRIATVFIVLGGLYADEEEYDESYFYYRKATVLKPQNELASLGVYLRLIDLDEHEEALHELQRYLNRYPANLYKTTLEELLEGLEKGYTLKYKRMIEGLARKNGVQL